MKFYETHFDEYYQVVDSDNYHDDLLEKYKKFPEKIAKFGNTIIYGPSGVGKYSQMLFMIRRYSPSLLKYEKHLTASIEKQTYTYRISDIHYEIDMSLLGCNSKILWHEIFQQIVDIVSVKSDKHGIIVCKNFHCVHNELLEIFYSYMQQYSVNSTNIVDPLIKIKFILITEHFSFIPNNVCNSCYILPVKRPSKDVLTSTKSKTSSCASKTIHILDNIRIENIVNMKEIKSFKMLNSISELPSDNFNVVCDNIIKEMFLHMEIYKENLRCGSKISVSKFRDQVYDILIYNLDVCDCVWYIFNHFVEKCLFDENVIDKLIEKIVVFLKQYGNNYRAIFHIESVLFSMICSFSQVV
jgi:hypothetical protein